MNFILAVICLFCVLPTYAQLSVSEQEKEAIKLFLDRANKELEITPSKLDDLLNEGIVYQEQRDLSNAKESFSQFLNLLKDFAKILFTALDLEECQTRMDDFLLCVEYIKNSGIVNSKVEPSWGELVYDCELFSKSLFLEATNRLRFAVSQSKNKDLIELWKLHEELKSLYDTYKSYVAIVESDSTYWAAKKAFSEGQEHVFSSEIQGYEEVAQAMKEMKDSLTSTEGFINLLLTVSHDPQINFTTSWVDVRNSLSNTQAAVEFVSCRIDSLQQYAAIVIRSDSKHPQVIRLFDERMLSGLLENQVLDLDSLYGIVWKPVEKCFQGIDEIFISASGMMSKIPFAALNDNGKYLLDSYVIRNVISTKDIIWLQEAGRDYILQPKGNAFFLGGADFGIFPKHLLDLSKNRGQGFDYLPESKKEVMFCAEILANMGWKTAVFTDEFASEKQLKESLSTDSVSIVHIATHGFNLPMPEERVFDMKMSDIGSVYKAFFRFSRNPLIHSGLLLSGANHVWQGEEPIEGIEDGVVTGIDISHLNLIDTELVIVSACFTALGQIDYSEGVYGLQRAFRIAGAHRMILSLWDVSDKESSEFIQQFYIRLSLGESLGIAFRNTQKRMKEKYFNDYKKWAGFVLIG